MAISTTHCACPAATRLAETGAAGSKSLASDWQSLPLCVQQLLLSAAVFRMVLLNDCRDGQCSEGWDWLRLGFQKTSTWPLIGWCSLCARGVSAAAFWMVLRLRSRRRPWAKGVRMVLVHVGYLVLPVFGSVRSRGIVVVFFCIIVITLTNPFYWRSAETSSLTATTAAKP